MDIPVNYQLWNDMSVTERTADECRVSTLRTLRAEAKRAESAFDAAFHTWDAAPIATALHAAHVVADHGFAVASAAALIYENDLIATAIRRGRVYGPYFDLGQGLDHLAYQPVGRPTPYVSEYDGVLFGFLGITPEVAEELVEAGLAGDLVKVVYFLGSPPEVDNSDEGRYGDVFGRCALVVQRLLLTEPSERQQFEALVALGRAATPATATAIE